MIFFKNQLMHGDNQARLFMATNPKAFEKYEDHVSGIYFHLFDLVEKAILEGENPKHLIEHYLGVYDYTLEQGTIEGVVNFLMQTVPMQIALHQLKNNWNTYDPKMDDSSFLVGGNIKDEEFKAIYFETTLRSYLESLSQVFKYG